MSKVAKETLETLETLVAFLRREGLTRPDSVDLLHAAKGLRKAVATMRREATKQCNGILRYDAKAGRFRASWTDADQRKSDRAMERAAQRAREALELVFWCEKERARYRFAFRRDARGAMVEIFPSRVPDSAPLVTF